MYVINCKDLKDMDKVELLRLLNILMQTFYAQDDGPMEKYWMGSNAEWKALTNFNFDEID